MTAVASPVRIDRIVEQVAHGVVQLVSGQARAASCGAGAVWARDPDGRCLVMTNAHVATTTPVTLTDRYGESRPASLLARDRVRDLALVCVDEAPASWQPIPPASGAPLRAGAFVMAIGHPRGVRHAVTTGVIHGVGPLQSDVELPAAQRSLSWILLDLRLAPGNSGGPVVNAQGELVGISTMIARGVGLAIPLATIDDFVTTADGAARLAHGWSRGRTRDG